MLLMKCVRGYAIAEFEYLFLGVFDDGDNITVAGNEVSGNWMPEGELC